MNHGRAGFEDAQAQQNSQANIAGGDPDGEHRDAPALSGMVFVVQKDDKECGEVNNALDPQEDYVKFHRCYPGF